MTVTTVHKDPEALTMTITAEFAASPERVWRLWEDPRLLERWGGPPTYPAAFPVHDLRPGGPAQYHMTGPTGHQPHAYWDVVEVDPPRRLVVEDGFAGTTGIPDPTMPKTTMRVTIEPIEGGRTRMELHSQFADPAAMERQLKMGM